MKENEAINDGSSKGLVAQFLGRVEKTEIVNTKHPILILANMTFKPSPLGNEVRLLSLAVVHMLYLFAYPSLPSSGYAKFTIGFDLENPDVIVTVGHAIRLYGDDGKLFPISTVYGDIVSTLNEFAKKYEESSIVRLTLRVYTVKNKVVGAAPSREGVEKLLEEVIRMDFPQNESKPIRADEIRHGKRSYAPPI